MLLGGRILAGCTAFGYLTWCLISCLGLDPYLPALSLSLLSKIRCSFQQATKVQKLHFDISSIRVTAPARDNLGFSHDVLGNAEKR